MFFHFLKSKFIINLDCITHFEYRLDPTYDHEGEEIGSDFVVKIQSHNWTYPALRLSQIEFEEFKNLIRHNKTMKEFSG